MIGIITAMDEETEAVKNKMTNIIKSKIYDIDVFTGEISGKEVALAKCGVGKVNASRTTQLLIERNKVDYVINVGSAGATNPNLDYGDIVISDKCIQHDFDISAFGHEKGYISDLGKFFMADDKLVSKSKKILEEMLDDKYKTVIGTIASGDQFQNSHSAKAQIFDEFGADCVEMEGAAIAQTCKQCEVPFLVVRSITDKSNENEHVDFYEYLEMASKRCADFIEKLV
ncbi:MAG: 5'-methylthioadenosine/adenosylhomocysteine nucleosidase [Clostridia bacterium]